jgi:ArsR family transcriptional regulator
MVVDLELVPKQKRPAGERCCEPVVYPDVERDEVLRMAEVAKALGDPIRLQLVDVLRKHARKVCVCELVPLFDISQPTLSHHLGKLRARGDRRLRAPRSVGLLLRQTRSAQGALRVAELETICCTPEAQASCGEPENKAERCGSEHDAGCGCSAGEAETGPSSSATVVRDTVREKYAAAARAVAAGADTACWQPGGRVGRVRGMLIAPNFVPRVTRPYGRDRTGTSTTISSAESET